MTCPVFMLMYLAEGRAAAQMAVEDFGGKVFGLRSRLSLVTIKTSPMSAPALHGNGLTRIT